MEAYLRARNNALDCYDAPGIVIHLGPLNDDKYIQDICIGIVIDGRIVTNPTEIASIWLVSKNKDMRIYINPEWIPYCMRDDVQPIGFDPYGCYVDVVGDDDDDRGHLIFDIVCRSASNPDIWYSNDGPDHRSIKIANETETISPLSISSAIAMYVRFSDTPNQIPLYSIFSEIPSVFNAHNYKN